MWILGITAVSQCVVHVLSIMITWWALFVLFGYSLNEAMSSSDGQVGLPINASPVILM